MFHHKEATWLALLLLVSVSIREGLAKYKVEYLKKYETLHTRTVVGDALQRSRRHTGQQDRPVRIDLALLNKRLTLNLQPQRNLFSESAKLRLRSRDGVRHGRIDRSMFHSGTVEGYRHSFVHGVIKGGLFHGVIRAGSSKYHVQPLHLFDNATQHSSHDTIVYEEEDVAYPHPARGACPSGTSHKLHNIQESARSGSGTPLDEHLRRKRDFDNEKKTCRVALVADYTFFSTAMKGDEADAIAEMTFHIMEASTIFSSTQFNLPSTGEPITDINFQIDSVDVYTDENNRFRGTFGTDEMLTAFSALDFDSVCLAHLFLHRDFDNGVLGLAWVASPGGSVGGICQRRTRTAQGELNLNTGYTTTLNFGSQVPRSVSSVTTTHEFGHNFGSPHDGSGPCSPGGAEGNYVMYASATDGSKPNNRLFSSCSRTSISAVLDTKATCFDIRRESSICGNGIREGAEECDCGSPDPEECRANDPCCLAGNCTLLAGMPCSVKWDACCEYTDPNVTDTCRLASESKVCGFIDTCQEERRCTGQNKTCPARVTLPDGSLCNDNSSTCQAGSCSGSLCGVYGLQPCECTDEGKECHLCCLFDTTCRSMKDVNDTTPGSNITTSVYLPGNAPCKDYTGYCDANTEPVTCISVDDQDPLDDLKDIFDTISVGSIVEWVKKHWPETLGGFGGAIVLFILLRISYRPKKIEEGKGGGSRSELEESVPLIDRRSR